MKKGIKTLITGILLSAVGAIVVPIAVVLPLILDKSDQQQQFVVPSTTEVEVGEPGRHYLWNDYQTFYDGKNYSQSKSIPDGIEIHVADLDGKSLPFTSDTSISSSVGSYSKNSIGYVEVDSPGKLTVAVSGSPDNRVFSFSKSEIMKILGLIFGGIGLCLLLTTAGIGISIWGIIKLVKK